MINIAFAHLVFCVLLVLSITSRCFPCKLASQKCRVLTSFKYTNLPLNDSNAVVNICMLVFIYFCQSNTNGLLTLFPSLQ